MKLDPKIIAKYNALKKSYESHGTSADEKARIKLIDRFLAARANGEDIAAMAENETAALSKGKVSAAEKGLIALIAELSADLGNSTPSETVAATPAQSAKPSLAGAQQIASIAPQVASASVSSAPAFTFPKNVLMHASISAVGQPFQISSFVLIPREVTGADSSAPEHQPGAQGPTDLTPFESEAIESYNAEVGPQPEYRAKIVYRKKPDAESKGLRLVYLTGNGLTWNESSAVKVSQYGSDPLDVQVENDATFGSNPSEGFLRLKIVKG